jgi:hypothetical protein
MVKHHIHMRRELEIVYAQKKDQDYVACMVDNLSDNY